MAETTVSRLHVLVVEDDKAIAELIRQVAIEQPGLDVDIARTSHEALDSALLRDKPVDLLILDLRLPETNGEDIIADLRKHGLKPAVLVISATSARELDAAARRVNAYATLSKPFDLSDLTDKLRQGLDSARSQAGTPRRIPVHRRLGEASERLIGSDANILAKHSREALNRSREIMERGRKLKRSTGKAPKSPPEPA